MTFYIKILLICFTKISQNFSGTMYILNYIFTNIYKVKRYNIAFNIKYSTQFIQYT